MTREGFYDVLDASSSHMKCTQQQQTLTVIKYLEKRKWKNGYEINLKTKIILTVDSKKFIKYFIYNIFKV